MPLIPGTIIVQPIPAVIVTTNAGAPSYESMRKALGDYVLQAYRMYIASQNRAQIQVVYAYNKYDANGNAMAHVLTPVMDPYQYQNTIFYEMRDRPVLIDGRNSINFLTLAGTSMQFKLYSIQTGVGQILEESDFPVVNNFRQLESASGLHGFFEEFTKSIPMEDPGRPKLASSNINFTITNTTTSNIPLSFLGNLGNAMDISNQFTESSFDVTPVVFPSVTTIVLTFQNTGISGTHSLNTGVPLGSNMQGVIDALNGLKVSEFYSEVSGPNSFINTYNDKMQFISLQLS